MNRAIFLLFTIVTLLFSQPVQVMIPDTQADSGAICLIPIMIDTVTGRDIIGVDITLNFRAEVLHADSVWTGNVVPSGWMALYNATSPGQLVIALAGADPLTGEGTLCTLKFTVTGRPNDTTTIHFSRCELNEGGVPCTTRDGLFTVTAVSIEEGKLQSPIYNLKALPNPFKTHTAIRFSLSAGSNASLNIYDITGKLVKSSFTRFQAPGNNHCFIWDGTNDQNQKVAPGIYYYELKTDNFIAQEKITVLR